jgi:hypothetical protein
MKKGARKLSRIGGLMNDIMVDLNLDLNKAEVAEIHGKDQVQIWRRSFDVLPPVMTMKHPNYNDIGGLKTGEIRNKKNQIQDPDLRSFLPKSFFEHRNFDEPVAVIIVATISVKLVFKIVLLKVHSSCFYLHRKMQVIELLLIP